MSMTRTDRAQAHIDRELQRIGGVGDTNAAVLAAVLAFADEELERAVKVAIDHAEMADQVVSRSGEGPCTIMIAGEAVAGRRIATAIRALKGEGCSPSPPSPLGMSQAEAEARGLI